MTVAMMRAWVAKKSKTHEEEHSGLNRDEKDYLGLQGLVGL